MRALIALSLVVSMLLFATPALAGSAPPASVDGIDPPPSDEQPPLSPYDIFDPITDSYSHTPNVTTPPPLNPPPNPVGVGHELVEIAFHDSNGLLHDAQFNLTLATLKVFQGGVVVAQQSLSPTDIVNIRDSMNHVAAIGVIELIVGGAITLVGIAITIGYSEFADWRECNRGVIAGNNNISAQIIQCKRAGRQFDVINQSTWQDCGASALAVCI